MRQAGRCLPSYRAMRERHAMLEMARTPDLAADVTLMAVDQLGVDGAILFSDIMIPLESMGVSLEIQPEVGPIVHNPIRTLADVDRLRVVDPREGTPYVLDALRQIRKRLADGRAATIGFAGAPYTLACYLIEGRPSREFLKAKTMMLAAPEVWSALMTKLAEQMTLYLRAQIGAGAQVVQLFDSWVGALSPADFETSVLPWTRRIFDGLRDTDTPTIYFGTGNGSHLPLIATIGSDIVGVDWRVGLDDAWTTIGAEKGIQGNLDPARIIAGWDATSAGLDDVLDRAGGRAGHIFNLGHGVFPETDPAILCRVVEAVHQRSSRKVG
jgi:uroporphyrinogen decarboxylase